MSINYKIKLIIDILHAREQGKCYMKLSVIIPCLNAEDTIATQLEALAGQKWYGSWEVIVSDNGSTDNSLKIVEKYKDRLPNLQITDASDRRGAAHAQNIGAKAATGKGLLFCDADDEVGPGWLTALGMALLDHDFVACRTDIAKLNTNWVKKSRPNPQREGLQKFSYPPFLPHAGGSTIGVKRWLHKAIGGFDESLLFLQDTDYCWRIQLKGIELIFVPNAVIHIRFRKKFRDIFRQGSYYGTYNIVLCKKYEQLGMPKLSWKKEVLFWVYSVKSLIQIRDKGDLASWIWALGWRFGRLKGSITYKRFSRARVYDKKQSKEVK